jgi:hypothetical protein
VTIENLMQAHAALSAQIDAIPLDQSIDEVFQRRWTIEETILGRAPTTVQDLQSQLLVLAARARDDVDVSAALEQLAAMLVGLLPALPAKLTA